MRESINTFPDIFMTVFHERGWRDASSGKSRKVSVENMSAIVKNLGYTQRSEQILSSSQRCHPKHFERSNFLLGGSKNSCPEYHIMDAKPKDSNRISD